MVNSEVRRCQRLAQWVSSPALSLCALLLASLVAPEEAAAIPSDAATRAYADGKPNAALKHLSPKATDAETGLLRARALLDAGHPKRAARALRRLARRLPQLRDYVLFLKGEAARLDKRYRQAEIFYKRAILLRGSRWVDLARQRRAQVLLHARRWSLARRAYQRLLGDDEGQPRRPTLELGLARAERHLGLRKQAARRLREIWLQWPQDPAAKTAKRRLSKLLRSRRRRVRLAPLTGTKLLERAHRLYRAKHFDAALAQLNDVIRRFPRKRAQAQWQRAWVLWKAGRVAASRSALKPLRRSRSPRWRQLARKHDARCLARQGHLDRAIALYTPALPPREKKRVTPSGRRALAELATLLEDHGRYAKALGLVDRLRTLLPWSRALKRRATWLAYRAGRYNRAILGFQKYFKAEAFRLYWSARAHEKAGHRSQAEALYRQLVERHLRGYYGLLARSRLVEKGKLSLAAARCTNYAGVKRVPVEPLLSKLVAAYGALLPDLQAVRTLWRTGLRVQARRHLRLAFLDYTDAVYRNRRLAFRIRQRPLRLWRGSKTRPHPKPSVIRALRAVRKDLGPALGKLAYAAGLDYFGWRLSPASPNLAERAYPRAWAPLIARTAKRFDLDPNLLWAIMRTESVYRPDVISRVKAGGLMQLMPTTAARLAKELKLRHFEAEDVFRPEINLLLAGKYLQAVSRKFHVQVPLIAAAYNGGPHNVARWLDYRGKGAAMDEFIEEIPFAESKRYAKKIVRLMALYERTYCNKDDQILPNALNTSYLPYPNF